MKKILSLSILLFALLSIHSCKQQETASTEVEKTKQPRQPQIAKSPGFVHAVYFWLKKDNPELLKEFMEEGLLKLADVPSIQSVSWGPPAGTPREVVDNSYDLAWIVEFENAEEQDKYQVDPIHVAFVKKYESLFEKVQVYDNTVKYYVEH